MEKSSDGLDGVVQSTIAVKKNICHLCRQQSHKIYLYLWYCLPNGDKNQTINVDHKF